MIGFFLMTDLGLIGDVVSSSSFGKFAHIRAYAIRPYSLQRKTKFNDIDNERIPNEQMVNM